MIMFVTKSVLNVELLEWNLNHSGPRHIVTASAGNMVKFHIRISKSHNTEKCNNKNMLIKCLECCAFFLASAVQMC